MAECECRGPSRCAAHVNNGAPAHELVTLTFQVHVTGPAEAANMTAAGLANLLKFGPLAHDDMPADVTATVTQPIITSRHGRD